MHEFRRFSKRILLSEDLNLTPFDFSAILMEEPALTLTLFPFFTNESRFPAFFVDTDIFGIVAIWTIG